MEAEREAPWTLSINHNAIYIQPANFLLYRSTVSNAPFIRSVDIGGFLFSELLSLATLSLGNVRTPPSSSSASLLLSVYFWSLELDPSRTAATSANATSWNATCLLTNWLRNHEQNEKDKSCLASLNLDKVRCLLLYSYARLILSVVVLLVFLIT